MCLAFASKRVQLSSAVVGGEAEFCRLVSFGFAMAQVVGYPEVLRHLH